MNLRAKTCFSSIELAQHATWTEKLNSSLSTAEEKKNARIQIDALEWKGQTGPVMEAITKLTERLNHVEAEGQSMSDVDRKSLVELRKLAEILDKDKLEILETNTDKCLAALLVLSKTEAQHYENDQVGWSKHERMFVESKQERDTIDKYVHTIVERFNEKFREVEGQIECLRHDFKVLIAEAMEEATANVLEETEAAALTAVGNLLGDSTDDEISK